MNTQNSNLDPAKIISVVPSGGSCNFEPGGLNVAGGDDVIFRNQTEKTVAIIFSNQEIFDTQDLILAPGQAVTLTANEGTGGQVTCTVSCDTSATKVPMTTKPTIIVNRK